MYVANGVKVIALDVFSCIGPMVGSFGASLECSSNMSGFARYEIGSRKSGLPQHLS